MPGFRFSLDVVKVSTERAELDIVFAFVGFVSRNLVRIFGQQTKLGDTGGLARRMRRTIIGATNRALLVVVNIRALGRRINRGTVRRINRRFVWSGVRRFDRRAVGWTMRSLGAFWA